MVAFAGLTLVGGPTHAEQAPLGRRPVGPSKSSPPMKKAGTNHRAARVAPDARPLARGAKMSAAPGPWASNLPPVSIKNRNTNAKATLRLYESNGGMDRGALRQFMRVACSVADAPDEAGEVAEPLDPRLVKLVFRAAYHFTTRGAPPRIIIVSATRKGDHGKHSAGDAIDFQLEGVSAASLAAWARLTPRAGVGLYTHPSTQYVHLDVRDHSYHWVDGSPSGVKWPEKLLPDPTQQKRDASYVAASDLPEVATR